MSSVSDYEEILTVPMTFSVFEEDGCWWTKVETDKVTFHRQLDQYTTDMLFDVLRDFTINGDQRLFSVED